ncbi:hypothetical protein Gain_0077_078 [Komagataeibacter intermedius TF2]|uniref:Uncharacterized protein n=1 Tax=Komagataeibacter intermedius NRIC 0521 TaxID=1307934 RepID=A0ABQ0PQZ5_9PROT|nr:hypothetical protein Gain_0077_078 [Komagataeibacter intermedius TF2]GBQ78026.1 hypothetical protein AA0521_3098 [Komagataeibacter intermedius NRIC 0521]
MVRAGIPHGLLTSQCCKISDIPLPEFMNFPGMIQQGMRVYRFMKVDNTILTRDPRGRTICTRGNQQQVLW